MSINLNKGEGAGSAPENKNPDAEGKAGLDANKINFSKSPLQKDSTATNNSEKSGVDSSKINFEKAPITEGTPTSENVTSKLDSSKINYEKKPLPKTPTLEKTSDTKSLNEKTSQYAGSAAEKKSTNNVWIGLAALVIIGFGLWYMLGSSRQNEVLTDATTPAPEAITSSANPQEESGTSTVDTIGASGNESLPTTSNESSSGSTTALTSSTELEPSAQQVAASSSAGTGQGSNQNNSTIANNPAKSNSSVSNQARPGNSNSRSTPSSVRNKNVSANSDSRTQSAERSKANNKSNSSASDKAMENIPVAQFGFGSTDASQLNDDLIQQIINRMSTDKSVNLQVNGYASSDGPLDLNVLLSQERANKFREMLIEKGLQQERITAIGRGIENPIGDNNTPEGRKMNRRVELDFQ